MTLILIYSFSLLIATVIWLTSSFQISNESKEKVTAVIVVRNEQQNILTLLESLKNQTYQNFEIIIVDDNSTDNTVNLIKRFGLLNLKLLHLTSEERGNAPKKAGIEKAIKNAEGTIIFSTDGDCKLSPKIIENYAGAFSDPKIHFLAGPVTFMANHTLWTEIQTVEFSSLIGSAAIAMFFKHPIMSSAANLAYRRKTFLEVGGFDGSSKVASGDDEVLMNKINLAYKDGVRFLKNKECIVETKASLDVLEFYNQRKRWAGKWSTSINWTSKITAVLIFIINAFTIYYGVSGTWEILLTKFVSEFIFLGSVLSFLKKKSSIKFIPLTQFLYPFYVVFFGLISLVPTQYVWKDRKLK